MAQALWLGRAPRGRDLEDECVATIHHDRGQDTVARLGAYLLVARCAAPAPSPDGSRIGAGWPTGLEAAPNQPALPHRGG